MKGQTLVLQRNLVVKNAFWRQSSRFLCFRRDKLITKKAEIQNPKQYQMSKIPSFRNRNPPVKGVLFFEVLVIPILNLFRVSTIGFRIWLCKRKFLHRKTLCSLMKSNLRCSNRLYTTIAAKNIWMRTGILLKCMKPCVKFLLVNV
jgi:nitrate reductase NapE component